MNPAMKRLILGVLLAAAAFLLAIILPRTSGAEWYSILPPVIAVGLAFLTHRVMFSLGIAVLVGGLLTQVTPDRIDATAWGAGLEQTVTFAVNVFVKRDDAGTITGADWDRLQIFLFVTTMLAAVMVMVASGGLQGVINLFTPFARGRRSTQVVTAATGMLVFIDDYANTMIVGNAMRPLSDKHRVSREKLAFLVDATSAPVAGIALLSTWIGFEVGLFDAQREEYGLAMSGYEMFLQSLPFYFYCFLMLAFVLINAGSGKDFGPMARAQREAQAHPEGPAAGHPVAAGGPDPDARVYTASALIPIGLMFAVLLTGLWLTGGGPGFIAAQGFSALLSITAWREAMGEADLYMVLLLSSTACLIVASMMALWVSQLPVDTFDRAIGAGIRTSLLPLGILMLAGALQNVCGTDGLGTGVFLGGLIRGGLPESMFWLFPLVVFCTAGATSLAIGTSWGTMGILIPIVFPIAYSLDGTQYGLITMVSLAAVLDGSIFGDHCSPISDTTIMSSTASGCDHIKHVQTQLPYSLVVGGMALVCGYLPAALGIPAGFGFLLGVVMIGLLYWGMPRREQPVAAGE